MPTTASWSNLRTAGDTRRVNGGIPALVAEIKSRPRESALLCDLDGTLAPIVDRPSEVAVPESATEALGALAGEVGLVAVITGRPAALARDLVGAEDLIYVGNHGLETLEPGQPKAEPHPALRGSESAAADLVAAHAQRLARSGVSIEDKGPIVALHWRTAPDRASAEREANAVAEQARGAGLEPRAGRLVMEVRPTAEIDKGTAVSGLLERHAEVRVAVFGGDDLTDLDAFAALEQRREGGDLDAAWRVAVLSAESPEGLEQAADLSVDGTEGFMGLLDALDG